MYNPIFWFHYSYFITDKSYMTNFISDEHCRKCTEQADKFDQRNSSGQDWHWKKKAQGLFLKERPSSGQSFVGDQMALSCECCAGHSLVSPGNVGSSIEHMSYNNPQELYRASDDTHWICFSASLKDSPIFPGVLRYFGSPVTAGICPRKARWCAVLFHCFVPSGAALLFQSVGFVKAWHTPLPKFWTYTQVGICNLTYSTAFNESWCIYKWKEHIYAWKRGAKHLVGLDINKTSRSFQRNFSVSVKKMPGAREWLVLARKQPWRCKIADKQRTAKQLLPGRYWIAVLGSSARYWMHALLRGLVKADPY